MLLGRLQPGPRKAANQSRGSLLLDKLVGVGQVARPHTPAAWKKFGALQAPPTLPTPQPKECTGQQKGAHVPFWISPMFSHICAHSTSTSHQLLPSVSRAGCLERQQGRYVPRISPSENTENSYDSNSCMHASVPFKT